MPFIDITSDDVQLFYVVNPTGALTYESFVSGDDQASSPLEQGKENIVLLHASMNSSASFAHIFTDARLRRSFNLIAFDAPYHGKTMVNDQQHLSLSDSADCIAEGLDHLQLGSYILIGEGFHGAHIAAWIAHRHPEKVKGLVLASPGYPEEQGATLEAFAEAREILLSERDGPAGVEEPYPAELLDAHVAYYLGSSARGQVYADVLKKSIELRYGAGHPLSDGLVVCDMSRRKAISEATLSEITSPALVIHGSQDKHASPLAAAQMWQSQLCNARGGADLRTIAGAPHLLLLTDWNIADRFILEFSRRCL